MPVATIEQRKANLARLLATISAHCPSEPAREIDAQNRARITPLTHAVKLDKLPGILTSEALLSQLQIGAKIREAERILETTDDVFLYVGAFGYPATECGFLFLSSIEDSHQQTGISTPFDSGALATTRYVKQPDHYPDGPACVRDHELPVSDYRKLLGTVIHTHSRSADEFLENPADFSCFCGVPRPHPFGLSGGDNRAATFEVRIPSRVPLKPPYLRAVFVPEGIVPPELSALSASGVEIVRYTPIDDGNYFFTLRNACIQFILEHIVP